MAKDTRFKKGQSGNPKGKPKGARNGGEKSKAVAKPHKRTEDENAYMKDFLARKAAKREFPEMGLEISDDGKIANFLVKHGDPGIANALMLDAFGTTDQRFFDGLSSQLIRVGGQNFNFMLSVVSGIEPRDQIEAMLAAQMAAVHMQTMTFARRLTKADTYLESETAEMALNRLSRTFTTQMEALNRYRGKGQQKMTVEHVHVHEGGQAVVGNVQGGGGDNKTEGQPHAITHAPVTPMPSQDEAGDVMPIPGNAQRKVPVARR